MNTRRVAAAILTTLLALSCMVSAAARDTEDQPVAFDSDAWILANADVVEHMGRQSLMGTAYLKDLELENGVLEVDLSVDGRTSYPGFLFRIQSQEDYERLYIRPHRAGRYPDALQYTPVFNGIAGWQLYSGEGFTAGAQIPLDQWVHLRMEIRGEQARVFIGDSETPALKIDHLKHGLSKGSVALDSPRDGTAYFSNFRYSIDDDLRFEPPRRIDPPPGFIGEWMISQSFKASQIDIERHPGDQGITDIRWQEVHAEPSGLVDIARYVKRLGREPDCVWAKATIRSNQDEVKKFLFGYSDWIGIFLNGEILFSANSAYRERDPSFLGIIGLSDAVYLPLRAGENELLFAVAESFGGWGFVCQDGGAVFEHGSLKKLWETVGRFNIPESVVYDDKRGVLYVSNYDAYNPSRDEARQFISRVSLDGETIDLEWVGGLKNPTGMAIFKGSLFVVERAGVARIDPDSRAVVERYPIPGAMLLNDIAVDQAGRLYVSDSRKDVILRSSDGKFDEWLKGGQVSRPNGVHVHRGELLVGNNGDGSIKAVDLESGEIRVAARLGPGLIDGIKTDGKGNLIVSHWEGRVYRVTHAGETTKLLDSTVPGRNSADFEYLTSEGLIIIPTFLDNGVVAYSLAEED
jgi:sugar lactone lactonase YvrE